METRNPHPVPVIRSATYVLFAAIVASFLFMVACRDEPPSSPEQDPIDRLLQEAGEISRVEEDSLCYLDLEAAELGDSFAAVFVFRGEVVQGTLLYLYEDGGSRYGKIQGTKEGHRLNLQWQYISEGNLDSLQLNFAYEEGILWRLPNEESDTLQAYEPVDCDQIPQVEFDLGL